MFNRRLGLLVVLVSLWASAAVFVKVVFREETERFESIQKIEHPEDMWKVDRLYMLSENLKRLPSIGVGPQDMWRTYENKERIRILAVGDSFTQGVGLLNLEDRWPTRLENVLNSMWGPASVEVVNMSAGGAAMFDYAEWINNIKDNKIPNIGRVKDIGPPEVLGDFDAVVLGFTPNDVVPGNFSKDGDGLVKVSPEEESGVIDGSIKDPNSKLFTKAVEDFATNAPAPLVLWYNLEYYNYHPERTHLEEVFRSAGYRIVPRIQITNLRNSNDPIDLASSRADMHPGPAVTSAYARDVAEYLALSLPKSRIRAAQGLPTSVKEQVLSSYLPTDMQVKSDSSKIEAEYDPITAQTCGVKMAVSFYFEDYSIDCSSASSPDSRPIYKLSDRFVPPQMLPCVQLGHPYIVFYLNQPQKNVKADLYYENQNKKLLTWYLVSSNEEGFLRYTKITKNSNPTIFDKSHTSENVVGFALADENQTCSPTDPPAFPKLTASIVIR